MTVQKGNEKITIQEVFVKKPPGWFSKIGNGPWESINLAPYNGMLPVVWLKPGAHLEQRETWVDPQALSHAPAPRPQPIRCKYGDATCPCQDGEQCHYEGTNPWPVPLMTYQQWMDKAAQSDERELAAPRPQPDLDSIALAEWARKAESVEKAAAYIRESFALCRGEARGVPPTPDELQELERFRTVTDYARCQSGSGPGDLQAYIEGLRSKPTQDEPASIHHLLTFVGCIADLEDETFTQEDLDELRRLAALVKERSTPDELKAEHDEAENIVIEEIASSTGPTGGWLDSPKAIAAAILLRLKMRRYSGEAPQPKGEPK